RGGRGAGVRHGRRHSPPQGPDDPRRDERHGGVRPHARVLLGDAVQRRVALPRLLQAGRRSHHPREAPVVLLRAPRTATSTARRASRSAVACYGPASGASPASRSSTPPSSGSTTSAGVKGGGSKSPVRVAV